MSDTALLRIGILAAGLLLIAAILLFGRPRKPAQGKRREPAESGERPRREPVLGAGEEAGEGVAGAEAGEVAAQQELGLPDVEAPGSELGTRATRISTRASRSTWPHAPGCRCAARTSWSPQRRPGWCSAT